ncbi:MAG TPA: sugar ABC transporter substrate-binding protein [Gemmatimonadales bacterium]|nr:sugar ABC transporter substrate-binding protein [Gemmatimonadales bacterium]
MDTLRVLLSLITRDNDYQREQASVAEATARRLGISLQVIFADNDAIAQTRAILAAIHSPEAERPRAVVVEPVGTEMLSVAGTAVESGVGWIVLNREADALVPLRQKASVPVGSVECDNVEVGRIQARQFAALLPSGGTVLYVEGPATEVARQRRAGLDEALPPSIKIQSGRGKWTEESGQEVLASRMQMQGHSAPSCALIGCQNDAMAMGARKAVEALPAGPQREQWMKIPLTGVDGVPATGQVWVQRGALVATVVTPALTGVALELLSRAVASGSQVPERTLVDVASYPTLEELRRRAGAPA